MVRPIRDTVPYSDPLLNSSGSWRKFVFLSFLIALNHIETSTVQIQDIEGLDKIMK